MKVFENFFISCDGAALREMCSAYPCIRGLLRRNDGFRHLDVLSIYCAILGVEQDSAAAVWAAARREGSVAAVADWLELVYPHWPARHVQKGDPLDVEWAGIFLSSSLGLDALSGIVLPKMRIMRWCSRTAIPTFTHKEASSVGTLLSAKRG